MKCCGIKACRNCAIKEVTSGRKCWKCDKPAKTEDVINDEVLRQKVENHLEKEVKWKEDLQSGKLLKCSVCDGICLSLIHI